MTHLHEELEITHRDLKPKNILVFEGPLLKISDFGIAREMDENSLFVSSKGDRQYAAPEVFNMERRQKLAPFKQDIYSLGLIACDMMAKELPLKNDIVDKSIKFYPDYSEELKDLVYSMLEIDPVKRPTIDDILASSVMEDELKYDIENELEELIAENDDWEVI